MKTIIESKKLSRKEKLALNDCKKRIHGIRPDAEIIIYGSRARGEGRFDSDYDLLVLLDGKVSIETEDILRQQIYPIELNTGMVLTIIAYSRDDWNTKLFKAMPFHAAVEQDGILL